jgi:quinol monooxygenase YgiN
MKDRGFRNGRGNTMAHRALIVEFQCKTDRVNDFVNRATDHAATVRREPGCLRCDVLRPEEGGTTVYLYELFQDGLALETHFGMPYMPKFVADFELMIESRTRTQCEVVNS